jgi:hypothetical protein
MFLMVMVSLPTGLETAETITFSVVVSDFLVDLQLAMAMANMPMTAIL